MKKSVKDKRKKLKKNKIKVVMEEFKKGELHSGKSKIPVKSRKQAIAIALSESRKLKNKKNKK
ncbi:MAG: DUF6496 domain-containing protein [Candidatus Omnitrophica bacterium]|nr:DUF6496 domain-containing protein [Candidatus Omnitrophota bacterium]